MPNFRFSEFGRVCGDRKITGHHQFKAACKRKTVDRSDYGNGAFPDIAQSSAIRADILQPPVDIHLEVFAIQIKTRGKGSAGAGQDDGPGLALLIGAFNLCVKRIGQRHIHGVQLVGPVQCQRYDLIFGIPANEDKFL